MDVDSGEASAAAPGLGSKRPRASDDGPDSEAAPAGSGSAKRARIEAPPPPAASFESKAARMMAKMGYSSGSGLGRDGRGRLAPVEASDQVSRQGLGFGTQNRAIRRHLADIRQDEKVGVVEVKIELEVEWAPDFKGVSGGIPDSFEGWASESNGVLHTRDEAIERKQDGSGFYCKICATSFGGDQDDKAEGGVDTAPTCTLAPTDSAAATSEAGEAVVSGEDKVEPTDPIERHEGTATHRERLLVASDKFTDMDLQIKVLEAKTQFDDVGKRDFMGARSRANPFELLRKEGFQNRAALKMAEMDALLGRLFTRPPAMREAGGDGNDPQSLLYFGDICAGPGGFSEYMLTVLKWRAKAFGLTIRGGLDFRVNKFNRSAVRESFRAYYGVDDSGDITKTENMRDFRDNVMRETSGKGLHVVMADGGIHYAGRENQQELMSKQLLLCQAVTAMATLRKGGVFVCKLFDTVLPFTVHCLQILRMHFDKVCLLKPNQSRPANSERYIVCKGLKQFSPPVVEYLFRVNDRMNILKQGYGRNDDRLRQRVTGLVPAKLVDAPFREYLRSWSSRNFRRQIMSLNNIMRFVLDRAHPPEHNQDEIRMRCREFWGLDPTRGPLPASDAAAGATQAGGAAGADGVEENVGEKKTPEGSEAVQNQDTASKTVSDSTVTNLTVTDSASKPASRPPPSAGRYVVIDPRDGSKIFSHERRYLWASRLSSAARNMAYTRDEEAREERLTLYLDELPRRESELKRWVRSPADRWYCYTLPRGGRRAHLFVLPNEMLLARRERTERTTRRSDLRRFEPRREERRSRAGATYGESRSRGGGPRGGIPSDTVLDVVVIRDSVHVLDVVCLAGDCSVMKHPFSERMRLAALFVESIRGGGCNLRTDFACTRVDQLFGDDGEAWTAALAKCARREDEPPRCDFFFIKDEARPLRSLNILDDDDKFGRGGGVAGAAGLSAFRSAMKEIVAGRGASNANSVQQADTKTDTKTAVEAKV